MSVTATFRMASGETMRLQLFPDIAPLTVANFADLCRQGFYDGLTFHRVVAGFMIQGGAQNGSCGGNNPGFGIPGEFAENGVDTGLRHLRGVISMARPKDPDGASTQFFILHRDTPRLDGKYAAFGALVGDESFAVLDRIVAVPTAAPEEENRPLTPEIIASITIDDGGAGIPPPVRIPVAGEADA